MNFAESNVTDRERSIVDCTRPEEFCQILQLRKRWRLRSEPGSEHVSDALQIVSANVTPDAEFIFPSDTFDLWTTSMAITISAMTGKRMVVVLIMMITQVGPVGAHRNDQVVMVPYLDSQRNHSELFYTMLVVAVTGIICMSMMCLLGIVCFALKGNNAMMRITTIEVMRQDADTQTNENWMNDQYGIYPGRDVWLTPFGKCIHLAEDCKGFGPSTSSKSTRQFCRVCTPIILRHLQ